MSTKRSQILNKRIAYLESLLSNMTDSENPSFHQVKYLANEIDINKAKLLEIEVKEFYAGDEM
jgi:hypothetical protein